MSFARAHLPLLALFAAAGNAAWTGCAAPDYGPAPFACAASPFCPEGYVCIERVCRRTATADIARPLVDKQVRDSGLRELVRPLDIGVHKDRAATDNAPGVLFEDHFSQASVWIDDGSGAWAASGGVFSQTGCPNNAGPDTMVPGKSWANVKVSVKLRGDGTCGPYGGDAGILVRVTSISACPNKYYYFCIVDFIDGGQLILGRMAGSCDPQPGAGNSTKITPLALGVWYTMQVTAVGNQFTCTVSAAGISPMSVAFTDTSSSALATGSVGLATDTLRVSFDDLVVTSP